MSTTHNELLQLIKTLETYVLNDAQLREVYNKNDSEFKKSLKSYITTLETIKNNKSIFTKNEKKLIPQFIAKLQDKYTMRRLFRSQNKHKTLYNNFLNEEKTLLKKILRHEMYKLLKSSPIPNESTNSFLNNFKPKP